MTEFDRPEVTLCCWQDVDPFTAPACKIPGWEMDRRACKQYILRSYNTSTFNAMRLGEDPFISSAKKKTKKA